MNCEVTTTVMMMVIEFMLQIQFTKSTIPYKPLIAHDLGRYKHIQNIIFGRPITVVEYLKLHLNTLFSLASSMRDGGILKDTRRIPIEKMTTNVPLYCGPQAKTKDTKN